MKLHSAVWGCKCVHFHGHFGVHSHNFQHHVLSIGTHPLPHCQGALYLIV